jgi:branched-chain amino acid transport system ATP-binding protein
MRRSAPGGTRLLEVRQLNKRYGSVVAADNVDLSITAGEALGIIGPNGAGKSTIFNLITGEIRPDAGAILLDAVDITTTPPHERCRAGISRSYQIPQPFENLTVFENLLVGAVYGQRKREQDVVDFCADILRRTNLLARANVLAGTLTLLQRKRLEMARALAANPRLLLLDEIAGGLTDGECSELVQTIHDIHRAGTTIVWIEHIVHALLAVVQRLAVFNFGHKLAEGEPNAVLRLREVQDIYMGIEA